MDAGSKTCCGVLTSKCSMWLFPQLAGLLIALIPGIPYSFYSQYQIFSHYSETIKIPLGILMW